MPDEGGPKPSPRYCSTLHRTRTAFSSSRTLEREDKVARLREWYPDYFRSPGREALLQNNIQQIRLAIEADYEASPRHTIRIMSVIITF